jgi:hypothetical protein
MREGDAGRHWQRRRTPIRLKFYGRSRTLRWAIRFGFSKLSRAEVAAVAALLARGN